MHGPSAVRSTLGSAREFDASSIAPALQRRRLQCYLAQMVGDIVAVLLGFGFFGFFYIGIDGWINALVSAQMLLPVFLTIGLYNGAYSLDSLASPGRNIRRTTVAFGMSIVAVVLIAFLTKSITELSRLSFSGGAVCAVLLLIWGRLQMRSFIRWRCGANVLNQMVIDDDGPIVDLPGAIHISARSMQLTPNLNDPHALDRIGLVLRNIDRVVVSCPPERRVAWAMMLKGGNVEGEVLDDDVVRLGAQGARVIGDHGLLLVSAGPLGLRDRALKRIFDLGVAVAGGIVLAPLLIIVALAIKLEDGGPVLFVQRRMGRANRFFNMYKFRSMSVSQSDRDATVLTKRNDTRVTKVGSFIRRTSIDELPQILNILLGDMSVVGPRPHAIGAQAGDKLYWEVDLRYWQRHCLKPGLSGLAQVRGFRGNTEQEADLVYRLQSDLEYLEGWTIFRDISIIFQTLRVVVHDQAY